MALPGPGKNSCVTLEESNVCMRAQETSASVGRFKILKLTYSQQNPIVKDILKYLSSMKLDWKQPLHLVLWNGNKSFPPTTKNSALRHRDSECQRSD